MKRKLVNFYLENALAIQILGILGFMGIAVALVAAFVIMAPDRSAVSDEDLSPETILSEDPQGLPPERPLSLQGLVQEVLRAHGGRQALARMQSLARRGTLNLPDDSSVGAFYIFQQPDRLSYTLRFPTYELRVSYDGSHAWREIRSRRGPEPEVVELSPEETRMLARDASINQPLHVTFDSLERLRWVDDQVVGPREAYVVELRTPDQAVEERFFFDKHSFLMIRRERFSPHARNSETMDHLIFELSDYREVDGARYPFRERVTRNGEFLNELVTRELRVNLGILREYFSLSR